MNSMATQTRSGLQPLPVCSLAGSPLPQGLPSGERRSEPTPLKSVLVRGGRGLALVTGTVWLRKMLLAPWPRPGAGAACFWYQQRKQQMGGPEVQK